MAELSVNLTLGTDSFSETATAMYNVMAKAPDGKIYTIETGTNAYVTLETYENSATITRYAIVAGRKEIGDTTEVNLGFFHTDNAPSVEAGHTAIATIYNVTESNETES